MDINDILDDIVAFKMGDGPDAEWQSNSPLWNDSRIRKAWVKREEARLAGEVDEEDEEEVPDYASMRNDDLRAELAARSLSVEGTKAEMVARLEENDAAQ